MLSSIRKMLVDAGFDFDSGVIVQQDVRKNRINEIEVFRAYDISDEGLILDGKFLDTADDAPRFIASDKDLIYILIKTENGMGIVTAQRDILRYLTRNSDNLFNLMKFKIPVLKLCDDFDFSSEVR